MKNIHVLPTPNQSRLVKQKYDTIDRLCLADIATKRAEYKRFNLYITSDEEIKDCWVLNTHKNEVYFLKGFYGIQPITKKIILTTDQDLIKDGVQVIDDEFLEWFVENQSCEEVELKYKDHWDNAFAYYEIIIPKEEPKPFKNMLPMTQESLAEFKKNPVPTKKEALEEAEKELTKYADSYYGYVELLEQEAFKKGVKWLQERSHSNNEGLITLLKSINEYEALKSFLDKI